MRDEKGPDAGESRLTALEEKMQALPATTPPDDLLDRCLATVVGPAVGAPSLHRRPGRRLARVATALAAVAVLLAAVTALLTHPGPVDAAQQLKAVRAAWAEVPASHRVVRLRGRDGTRTEETWFVRGKGRRTETRSGDELIGVAVNNGRWEFRWDVREQVVAAWSAELGVGPPRGDDAGMVLESEGLLRWAESHRAEVRVEEDVLGGRQARKVVLRWPGPAEKAAGVREVTVWFDPGSLRPLKQRVDHGDGQGSEATFDYPAPGAVSDDLFAFRPPRDATLEINDPDLGRQVYSDAPARADAATPRKKGAER